MSRSTLLVRADANAHIGYGHIMRCLALAQAWQEICGPVVFACHSSGFPESIRHRLLSESIRLEPINVNSGSSHDASELKTIAEKREAAAVTIDGYQFDSAYLSDITSDQRSTLVIDDDAHLPKYPANFVLNQNLGVKPDFYQGRVDHDTELLLGSQFALLRREIRAGRSNAQPPAPGDREHKLLITLGGTQAETTTRLVLDSLASLDPSLRNRLKITLLSPVDHVGAEDLDIDVVPFADDMARYYRWADFAICGGGSSNWEMSYFGLPRIVIVMASNQTGIAAALQQRGCVWSAGHHTDLTSDELAESINRFLQDDWTSMKRANRNLIDGLGAERVARRLADAAGIDVPRRRQHTKKLT